MLDTVLPLTLIFLSIFPIILPLTMPKIIFKFSLIIPMSCQLNPFYPCVIHIKSLKFKRFTNIYPFSNPLTILHISEVKRILINENLKAIVLNKVIDIDFIVYWLIILDEIYNIFLRRNITSLIITNLFDSNH